jgi:diaminopimelate dehydrogenase
LEAVARRSESLPLPLPRGVPASLARCEAGGLRDVDAALVCVPRERSADVASQLLSRGIPIVEAAELHGLAFQQHREAIHREALRQRRAAVVGAGWDPGALPLLRGWLALLVPKGHTESRAHVAEPPPHRRRARPAGRARRLVHGAARARRARAALRLRRARAGCGRRAGGGGAARCPALPRLGDARAPG